MAVLQIVTANKVQFFNMSKKEHIGTLTLGPRVNALLVWEVALQQLKPLCYFLYCFSALSVARQQLPLFHCLQFSFFTLVIKHFFFYSAAAQRAQWPPHS